MRHSNGNISEADVHLNRSDPLTRFAARAVKPVGIGIGSVERSRSLRLKKQKREG
jgi:hypothetical protein